LAQCVHYFYMFSNTAVSLGSTKGEGYSNQQA